MKPHLTFITLALSAASSAETLHTGPFGPDGTWNLYQLVKNNLTWDEARKEAEATPAPAGDPGAKGHLVTFASIAENQFVRRLNREQAWCGLNDDERFGGHEAGSHRREGWKWCDGETLAFSNWLPDQPDEWKNRGTGEDAVFFDGSGRWGDGGSGVSGQSDNKFYYVIEWETRAKSPVPGAIPYERVWPAKSVMPEYLPGKWNARWVFGYVKRPDNWIEVPQSLADGLLLLLPPAAPSTAKNKPLVWAEGSVTGKLPWLCLSAQDVSPNRWLPNAQGASNFPDLPQGESYIAAVGGKIHVEKAGSYSVAISATDAFALRVGRLKWKSVTGTGFIDPLDPLTVTQPDIGSPSRMIAVIDLPAGDHPVEFLWMAGDVRSSFEVLSAFGNHSSVSATAEWRPLGYVRHREKVPTLGVADAGWTVERSLPGKKEFGLQDGLIKLELDAARVAKTGVAAIDFNEDSENGASAFPGEPSGGSSDNWPLRATARLVVPRDGIYYIGLRAAGLGALRIKGGVLKGASQAPQGPKDFHQQPDSFDFSGRTDIHNEPEIVTTWDLKAGESDIEVFYVKSIGPASLSVTGCPDGAYIPSLIRTSAAALADDLSGLPQAR